jgi:septum formation protein
VTRLLLASTSPQRQAILEQLGLAFDIVAPGYVEHDDGDASPVDVVERHALGKARSVAGLAAGRLVLGVDTTVVVDGRPHGKAATPTEAAGMLADLAGRPHAVVSGLCLLGDGFEEVGHDSTTVVFRPLTEHEIAGYVATREWEGRAGAYAIQGRGAALVERIEGDYLNVVGLPAALLLRLLRGRFSGD